MTNEELWKIVLTEMELSLSRANFTTWFKGTNLLANANGCMMVSVPNGFIKEWLENKFNKQIFHIIRQHHPEVREIKYTIGMSRPEAVLSKRDFVQFIPEQLVKEAAPEDVNAVTNFNKRYTFDSFVVGPNNELAHAASLAVAKKPGHLYNPLFLYGGVGLGKTHLLQATGNYIAHTMPEKKMCYISTERLVAQIVESFKNRTTEHLKQKFHGLDVLVVDDIQFLSGKTTTQDIFFSIFNELYAKNRQIILSSDRPPSTIAALEERLRSRFEGGMIADIGIPEYETRLAILAMKAKEKNFEIDAESLDYIASNIQKNIRELEGALNRIIAFGQIYNKTPALKEIKQLLGTYVNAPYRKPTSQSVIKSVADFYRIAQTDLVKRSRRKEVVRPRQIAMFLLREEVKYSFPEIGARLGGRDHSTVIHACTKIKEEELNNDTTRQELNLIKERIYQNFETA
ncbi:MAG: chromosomal replication initiator protein DnaA [Patescibacteria group bacterium]